MRAAELSGSAHKRADQEGHGMVNLYDVLGVTRHADGMDIKVAYRKLAKTHHPDLHAGDSGAVERFQVINCAYEILRKPDARAAYDRACAVERSRWRARVRSAAMTMAASFMLTVSSGLLIAGWMRIEGII